jgi:hypothetical protein
MKEHKDERARKCENLELENFSLSKVRFRRPKITCSLP